jgi:hypothetical protein
VEGGVRSHTINTALETIGLHLHFSTRLERIALDILRSIQPDIFIPKKRTEEGYTFPPYISVHIRRDDFEEHCHRPAAAFQDKSACFTPLSVFAEAVENVKSELILKISTSSSIEPLTEEQIRALPVIVFSDEPRHSTPTYIYRFHRANGSSEAWWAGVDNLKWISIDHQSPLLDTEKKWGYWYPSLVDSVLMSNAVGFVGTEMSTYSLLAGLRVHKWKGGPIRMISPVVN